MRKAVVILSLTTGAFATSTLYLARELYFRDAGTPTAAAAMQSTAGIENPLGPPVAATPAADAKGTADVAHAGGSASAASLPSGEAASTPNDSAKQDAQADAGRLFARQFLARYDDPIQRAALLEEARTGIRRQYAALKERLKLSDATFEQLVTLLADENLLMQEHFSRCAVDTKCDVNDPSRRAPYDAHSEEYLALLGAGKLDAFSQFRNSVAERDAVIQLRGRLPDSNFLAQAEAEQLIVALADERARFQREATENGAKVRGWGTQLGMLMYTEDSGSPDQYVLEATQYSQRLRARAAAVLTPAQYAAYVQMQEELLAQLTASLRPAQRKGSLSVTRSS